MEWKFQRECHNRQDKAQQGDYRDDMVLINEPESIDLFREKLRAKQAMMDSFREAIFFLQMRCLKLEWDLPTYAQKNDLDGNEPRTQMIFNIISPLRGLILKVDCSGTRK